MKVIFISRKSSQDIGGLSRFYAALSSHFSQSFFKPDLIHLCDATLLPLGIFLKVILRKPLTLTTHGLDLTFKNSLYQMMLRLLLPKVDAVIAVSTATRNLLNKFNLKKERIFIIPNGISITHFKSPIPPNIPNLPDLKDKLILLTVGNLVLRKGHVWFIKNVFTRLDDNFVFLIVGDGPCYKQIKQTINQLHLNSRVFLLGRLTNPQLRYVFNHTHIYVCPNQHIKGDFEGFGLSVGEATAMGLSVIASNIDGIPEVIKHGKNGWLVNPDAISFIAAIDKFKDAKLRKWFGKKAAIFTKKQYRWKNVSNKYLSVFLSLIQ